MFLLKNKTEAKITYYGCDFENGILDFIIKFLPAGVEPNNIINENIDNSDLKIFSICIPKKNIHYLIFLNKTIEEIEQQIAFEFEEYKRHSLNIELFKKEISDYYIALKTWEDTFENTIGPDRDTYETLNPKPKEPIGFYPNYLTYLDDMFKYIHEVGLE